MMPFMGLPRHKNKIYSFSKKVTNYHASRLFKQKRGKRTEIKLIPEGANPNYRDR
jgi:hypothetical protein